jgi:hypothetical protein
MADAQDRPLLLTYKSPIMPMSPEECRAHAEACERMAESLSADNAELRETMREVAAQWRWLADDRAANRGKPLT